MEVLFIHIYYLLILFFLYHIVDIKLFKKEEYRISFIEIDLFKNNINCLKSLYITNRDVDATIGLKLLVEYFNKLKENNQLTNEELESFYEKFLELKNLLLSLNNYRGIKSSIIETILNER